jgi:phosphoglycolate phosphatase-like HAD superfamily hydrolase
MFGGLIKNIFFDFDGVILDSVDCKTKAFKAMYEKYGNKIANEVEAYHIANGGVSRFEKFNFWHKEYLGINLTEKELSELSNEFSIRVVDKVVASREIEGSINFIKQNYNQYKCWIITGTPTSEMKQISDKLNISKYFLGIHGSPEKKIHWVDYLLKENQLIPNETLFLGDATTDYEAARSGNLHFALRQADYNKPFFENIDVPRFKTFYELNAILNEQA